MKTAEARLAGCYELTVDKSMDSRGSFTKIYHSTDLAETGWTGRWEEIYFSTSGKDVLRGMHFQTPPFHHHKLVAVTRGRILDVLLDVRRGSPTFGRTEQFELSASGDKALLIAPGVAHGFLSLEDDTTVLYLVSTIYSPRHDRGVLWNSFGFDWPVTFPIISARDVSHPALQDFDAGFGAVGWE